jgi:hypothetical protein
MMKRLENSRSRRGCVLTQHRRQRQSTESASGLRKKLSPVDHVLLSFGLYTNTRTSFNGKPKATVFVPRPDAFGLPLNESLTPTN